MHRRIGVSTNTLPVRIAAYGVLPSPHTCMLYGTQLRSIGLDDLDTRMSMSRCITSDGVCLPTAPFISYPLKVSLILILNMRQDECLLVVPWSLQAFEFNTKATQPNPTHQTPSIGTCR
jgi:hypothetical protein